MQATTRKNDRFSQLIVFGLLGLLLALSLQAATLNPANFERQTPPLAAGQSATLLPDGRWLLLGGQDDVGISGKAILSNLDGSELTVLDLGLLHARAWHSATLLPSGQVLILGGLDADGLIVERAERFDPKTQTFKLLPELELLPRARHTTTLMTDGRLLIAGGVGDAATPQYAAELFDPQSHQVDPYPVFFLTARADHHATLLPTEPVLLWGALMRRVWPLIVPNCLILPMIASNDWTMLIPDCFRQHHWPNNLLRLLEHCQLPTHSRCQRTA